MFERRRPEKRSSGLLRSCVNCDSTAMVTSSFQCIPAVYIISFCVLFLSRFDELNKLAGSQCMGLHSSAGRALQRERRGHGFKSRRSPEKLFSGLYVIAIQLRWSHIHFICFPAVHIISLCVSFLYGLMNLINWPALSVLQRKRRSHGFESRRNPE